MEVKQELVATIDCISLARATSVFQNRGLVFVLYLTGTIPQESWGTISADWSAIAV